jgi:hypothetical protein
MEEKHVHFGDITIQEYPMELGDNPACSCGVPITIGWEPQSTFISDLEAYEFRRPKLGKSRRQLLMPVQRRGHLLLKAGYSLEAMAVALTEVNQVKKSRTETFQQKQGRDRFTMMIQNMNGVLRRKTSGGQRRMPKRQE